jgi:hypothetical protein
VPISRSTAANTCSSCKGVSIVCGPPLDASFFFGFRHVIRRFRVSGLMMRSHDVWRYSDRVHIGLARLEVLRLTRVFPATLVHQDQQRSAPRSRTSARIGRPRGWKSSSLWRDANRSRRRLNDPRLCQSIKLVNVNGISRISSGPAAIGAA